MYIQAFIKISLLTTLYLLTVALVVSLFTPPHPVFFPASVRTILMGFVIIMLTRYIIYLILGLGFSWQSRQPTSLSRHRKQPYRPLVSVLIPAWNEEVGLLAAVQSVIKSSYRHAEIIVINDGSTDRSDAIMHDFLLKYRPRTIPVIYRYQLNAGKAKTLNKGLALARGDIIVTIDADSRMDRPGRTAHCRRLC